MICTECKLDKGSLHANGVCRTCSDGIRKEIINLKPKGSMIANSPLTNTNYHVTKFYSRVQKSGNSWIHKGFEATEQHVLGHCKFCAIEED